MTPVFLLQEHLQNWSYFFSQFFFSSLPPAHFFLLHSIYSLNGSGTLLLTCLLFLTLLASSSKVCLSPLLSSTRLITRCVDVFSPVSDWLLFPSPCWWADIYGSVHMQTMTLRVRTEKTADVVEWKRFLGGSRRNVFIFQMVKYVTKIVTLLSDQLSWIRNESKLYLKEVVHFIAESFPVSSFRNDLIKGFIHLVL